MRELADRVGDLIYEINNTLKLRDEEYMFVPSHEDYRRFKEIGKICTTIDEMRSFSTIMFTIVYEETKAGDENKARLGKFRNYPFTFYVSELRNYYDHGFAEYVSNRKIKQKDVIKRYLNKVITPSTSAQFQMIQEGVLNDFIDFLNEINEWICLEDENVPEQAIYGLIKVDGCGFAHCKNVLLPSRYKDYEGNFCIINNKIENDNPKTKGLYPLYSPHPSKIEVLTDGVIEVDENKVCHCGKVRLPRELKPKVGKNIQITAIRTLPIREGSTYTEEAVEYELVKEVEKKLLTTSEIKPTAPLNEKALVEVDNEGVAFVGNIMLPNTLQCKGGDIVRISAVSENQTKGKESSFPLVATSFEKVVDKNGIARIYTVKKDKNGNLHADNILIPASRGCEVGDRIMIFNAKNNKNETTADEYPEVAKLFARLNQDIPYSEEKATSIVSRFQKYIRPGLKWLGAEIVRIILIILGPSFFIIGGPLESSVFKNNKA